MGSGQVLTLQGKQVILNRAWKSSPDYTNPSVFKVGTGTNTPTTSDTDLQTPILIGGSSTKAFVPGYPILDESNLQVIVRCLLLTTECNGNSLTEFGIFNTDGTKKCFSRAVHTAISKTTSVQVIYVSKDKII